MHSMRGNHLANAATQRVIYGGDDVAIFSAVLRCSDPEQKFSCLELGCGRGVGYNE